MMTLNYYYSLSDSDLRKEILHLKRMIVACGIMEQHILWVLYPRYMNSASCAYSLRLIFSARMQERESI
jgi:hypothetical protein